MVSFKRSGGVRARSFLSVSGKAVKLRRALQRDAAAGSSGSSRIYIFGVGRESKGQRAKH